jgi:hypothetical protein
MAVDQVLRPDVAKRALEWLDQISGPNTSIHRGYHPASAGAFQRQVFRMGNELSFSGFHRSVQGGCFAA